MANRYSRHSQRRLAGVADLNVLPKNMSWISRLFGGKSADFPDDSNGDVFRRMRDAGDDLSKSREIDFNRVFQREEDAGRFTDAVRQEGYSKVSCEYADELKAWDARVQILMIPTRVVVTEQESKLDAIARKFGGLADGWGCMHVDKE